MRSFGAVSMKNVNELPFKKSTVSFIFPRIIDANSNSRYFMVIHGEVGWPRYSIGKLNELPHLSYKGAPWISDDAIANYYEEFVSIDKVSTQLKLQQLRKGENNGITNSA